MPTGPLIANILLFLNISKLLSEKYLHTFMFNMPREDIVEHTNDKCHMFTFKFTKGRYS